MGNTFDTQLGVWIDESQLGEMTLESFVKKALEHESMKLGLVPALQEAVVPVAPTTEADADRCAIVAALLAEDQSGEWTGGTTVPCPPPDGCKP